jgi:hypothetical protein
MALEFIRKDSEILFEVYRGRNESLSPINSVKKYYISNSFNSNP